MGKIYSGIEGCDPPKITGDFDQYDKECEKYIKDVKEFTKEHGSGLYAGKEVRFPVADGYARYMVLSLRPVELIHLDIEDGWNFQYVERLTAADIKEKLRSQKGLKKLFQN